MPDHLHMCLSGAAEVSHRFFVIGFLKGKSAVRIHRSPARKRLHGMHFWRWDTVWSTVG